MKIVLVNGWHDDNKGDGGIVEATISLVRQQIPYARFALLSPFPDDDPRYTNAHRHLRARFPDLEICAAAVPGYQPGVGLGAMLWALPILAWSISCLLMGIRGASRVFRLIGEADLVISKGGHIFYSNRPGMRGALSLLVHMYPLMIARRFGVPYILLGQSIGPFNDRVGRAIAKGIFNGARSLVLREGISSEVAREIGVDMSKVRVAPDLAFWLRGEMSDRVRQLMEKLKLTVGEFWVVTVRTWPPTEGSDGAGAREAFLHEMARFITGVLEARLSERIVLVAHVIGPIQIEDDRLPTRRLAELIGAQVDRLEVIDEDLTPHELIALYGSAELLVGTRFHSVIFALAGGTPAIAVSYFGPKARGIMRLLGMERFCIDIEHFTAEAATKCISELRMAGRVHIGQKTSECRRNLETTLKAVIA